MSTTVPLTDAVTVPVASPAAAEATVTAMFDVPPLTGTDAGVGVAVIVAVALTLQRSTVVVPSRSLAPVSAEQSIGHGLVPAAANGPTVNVAPPAEPVRRPRRRGRPTSRSPRSRTCRR